MRLQQNLNMAKWVLGVLCVSTFGIATLAEAAPRHPTVRRHHGGGGVYQRSVPMANYQYQRPYQVQQPVVWSRNVAAPQRVVMRPAVSNQVAMPVQTANCCE